MSTVTDNAADSDDIRPIVRRGGNSSLGLWGGALAVVLFGYMTFSFLSAGREEEDVAGAPDAVQDSWISAPPPLALPPDFGGMSVVRESTPAFPLVPAQAIRQPEPFVPPRTVERIVEVPAPAPPLAAEPPAPRAQVVYDASDFTQPTPAAARENDNPDRVGARRLANPSHTVPQGAIIAGVLETALDSTRPGAVRAIVSRDVLSFDGTRVLIPRGTRLYGEYSADVARGQKRALITWQRLTRPDGVIMNLQSPAADPLGRAGVKGDLDTHFLARFGSSILQSVLDIGVNVASRQVSRDGVVVALPGSTQNITGVQPDQIQPTLRVDHGTSVSVFVARDLDFSSVDS